MLSGIIYAVIMAVTAVVQFAVLFARVVGQLLGMLLVLTFEHPRVVIPLLGGFAVVSYGFAYFGG